MPGGQRGPKFAIIGTNKADRITGTNVADRIIGLGGNDKLDGGRGNDCIEGRTGGDTLSGGLGNDRSTASPATTTSTAAPARTTSVRRHRQRHDQRVVRSRTASSVAPGSDFINIATAGPAASATADRAADKIRLNRNERKQIKAARRCTSSRTSRDSAAAPAVRGRGWLQSRP